MKKLLLLFFCFAYFSIAFAQVEEPNKGYRGYVDFAVGDAYNFNTDQLISTNNMQWYTMLSTTHGYHWKNWFVGAGLGYYHSYRDKENMYPIYAAGCYTFESTKIKPYIEARAGIMYDPLWIEKVQKYGALSVGVKVYKGFQVGLRGSIFSRPSRYFTANAAVVISYAIGK
jgi:hypothetical protein